MLNLSVCGSSSDARFEIRFKVEHFFLVLTFYSSFPFLQLFFLHYYFPSFRTTKEYGKGEGDNTSCPTPSCLSTTTSISLYAGHSYTCDYFLSSSSSSPFIFFFPCPSWRPLHSLLLIFFPSSSSSSSLCLFLQQVYLPINLDL